MEIHKKYRFFLLLMISCTFLSFCFGRPFDLEADRDLSVFDCVLTKDVNGECVEILGFNLFFLEDLEKNGVVIQNVPQNTLGFLLPEILDEEYFIAAGKEEFVLDYYYTPFWGFLKDKDEYVETFLYFRDETADFGGRSYCPDCGEPMACGTRFLSIAQTNPIWMKNPWIDFKKSFEIDLLWTVEGESLAVKIKKD